MFTFSFSPTRCLGVWSRLFQLLFLRTLLFRPLCLSPLHLCVPVFAHLAVKPLKVKIVSPNEILTAGVKSPLRCEAYGSSPPGLFALLSLYTQGVFFCCYCCFVSFFFYFLLLRTENQHKHFIFILFFFLFLCLVCLFGFT